MQKSLDNCVGKVRLVDSACWISGLEAKRARLVTKDTSLELSKHPVSHSIHMVRSRSLRFVARMVTKGGDTKFDSRKPHFSDITYFS